MPTPWERYLPPGLEARRIQVCLGLISNTHLPERGAALLVRRTGGDHARRLARGGSGRSGSPGDRTGTIRGGTDA
jgi:hypothetical protein